MKASNCESYLGVFGCLFLLASAPQAATLQVSCGARTAGTLASIGAALKALQYANIHEPTTINVTGACRENVVIQSLDRLTLTANHASISDASGGTLDVIAVLDSRDVAINGFAVNGASMGSANGISCNDYSTCRLSGNVIQGAGNGGFAVYQQSQATLDGDMLQNNAGAGLVVRSGSTVRAGLRPFTSRNNGQGVNIGRQAFTYGIATIENNSDAGVTAGEQSTIDLGGSISRNGSRGADIREGSVARFVNATISGNAAEGVLVHDLSMVTFIGATVTGNGGTDVICAPQYSATRGTTTDINGGTTNCVEP